MTVNFRLKATKVIGQRKVFYRQRIPEPSCARKETVDIDSDILLTSKLCDETGHPVLSLLESQWKLRQQHDQNFPME